MTHNITDVPICVGLATIIVIIFSLYFTTLVKTLPCGSGVMDRFYSNFVHTTIPHMIGNLIGLYALARVEKNMGTKKFAILVAYLLIFNTLAESLLHTLVPSTPCSIGFSGILFGILTWELVTHKGIDKTILASILLITVFPTIVKGDKVSLGGHLIGSLSGVIGALLYTKFS
jgi:membrane associated rhomboid family serine protease